MNNKYATIKVLIDLYGEYEMTSKDPDIIDFAQWLIKQSEDEKENVRFHTKDFSKKDTPASALFKNQFDDKWRFLEASARIARYHDFYIRKYLKDLSINTRLEYLFLQTIKLMGQAKKTDLINMHHLEYTTGMDTIKRLINNGLLTEIQDDTDRRIRLLKVTDEGKAVYEKSRIRIREESNMFFTAINENKWKKALPVLEDIDDFHHSVYLKHSNKPVSELANLMDSLKHLFR